MILIKRGIVKVLFVNHSEKTFVMRTGDRIAQVAFIEQYNAKFKKVDKKDLLGTTKQGDGGFGSTGITVIIKAKENSTSDKEEQENLKSDESSGGDKSAILQIVEKPKDDLQITSEEAIMEVNNEAIIHEKITIG